MAKLDLLQILKGHTGRVWCVSWHPLGTALATCGEDKTIRIWGLEGDKWVVKTILTDGHSRTIREVSWSPCGNYIASASFDATTSIWDKKSGEFECSATLEGHENEVKSVAWSPDGHLLATCSRDKSVWVWEISSAIEDEFECAAVLNAHSQDVKKVIWHPNLEILASCSYDNTIKVFREDPSDSDWICTATLESHNSTVWSLTFNNSGDRLASCSADETVKIWQVYKPGNEQNIATPDNESVWKCVCTLAGYHTRAIYDLDWCKTSDLLVTACGDDMIRIFKENIVSDKHAPTYDLVLSENRAHEEDVNCVKWNPKNIGMLASCSDDSTVKLWMFKESDDVIG